MLHSIFDVHAHYDETVFDADRAEVLESERASGVCGVINSGSSVPSSRRSIDLAHQFGHVYASVGVFPLEAYDVPEGWLEQIAGTAGALPWGKSVLTTIWRMASARVKRSKKARSAFFARSFRWRVSAGCPSSYTTATRTRTRLPCCANSRVPA